MQLPPAMIERLRAGVGAAALLTATVALDVGCATQADAAVHPAAFAGMPARDNPAARPAPRIVSHTIAPSTVAPAPWPSAQSVGAQPVAAPAPVAMPEPVTAPQWECGPCGRG